MTINKNALICVVSLLFVGFGGVAAKIRENSKVRAGIVIYKLYYDRKNYNIYLVHSFGIYINDSFYNMAELDNDFYNDKFRYYKYSTSTINAKKIRDTKLFADTNVYDYYRVNINGETFKKATTNNNLDTLIIAYKAYGIFDYCDSVLFDEIRPIGLRCFGDTKWEFPFIIPLEIHYFQKINRKEARKLRLMRVNVGVYKFIDCD